MVQSIGPDAPGDPDLAAHPDATWYRALVRTDRATLGRGGPGSGAEGRALAVLPGMTGTVEIRTGQRSVPGFMLRPMLKSQKAFRER